MTSNARATQAKFIGQKLNLTFLVETQMKFKENAVPPVKEEEELSFFLVMTPK